MLWALYVQLQFLMCLIKIAHSERSRHLVTLKSNMLFIDSSSPCLAIGSNSGLHYIRLRILGSIENFFCLSTSPRGTILCRFASLASSLGWLDGNKS